MIFATGLHSCKKKFWILIQHFYFYSFLTYSEHIRKCSKLQIMIVFPVLIPVQNFLFPGTGRENLKCHGKGRDGKFEACIPGNHGKREFPLTPGLYKRDTLPFLRFTICTLFSIFTAGLFKLGKSWKICICLSGSISKSLQSNLYNHNPYNQNPYNHNP